MAVFTPTPEQIAIIEQQGSAFISACPGAGKTRCIVERAQTMLSKTKSHKGLAFLSFTNAAVSELQERMAKDRLLPTPVFPHFIGTFDSFIWHYLVAPFGLEGSTAPLRIVPDTDDLMVTPFVGAQPLRLEYFDRQTGKLIQEEARKVGFDRDPTRYEASAKRLRDHLLEKGLLDFHDVRRIAITSLTEKAFSDRLGSILSSRFGEVIVDEAQDCNPDDLSIIDWLRGAAKIPTKVVCDPHQSIYGFRGGVSDELFKYASTFAKEERLPLTGNFRSSRHICKAVHTLRAPSQRGEVDDALGELKDCTTSVHVLSYSGRGVSPLIGEAFADIASANGINPEDCRLAAKTRKSGLNAVGAYTEDIGKSLSMRLANAVVRFHSCQTLQDRSLAIKEVHMVALTISGRLNGRTYHQAIIEDDLETLSWRGQIVKILHSLHFDSAAGHTRPEWVDRAQNELRRFLPVGGGTIGQKLPNQKKLDDILGVAPAYSLIVRKIHEIKGKQYQGVCVVLTTATAKGVLTHLEEEPNDTNAERARELYVAASRAKELLVFACPKSQSRRLADHLSLSGATVQISEI
jgi:ATP-dependent DNA helicase UvrD/PcrA